MKPIVRSDSRKFLHANDQNSKNYSLVLLSNSKFRCDALRTQEIREGRWGAVAPVEVCPWSRRKVVRCGRPEWTLSFLYVASLVPCSTQSVIDPRSAGCSRAPSWCTWVSQ